MTLFKKKKRNERCLKVREDSPEVIAAREYLEKTHPTLIGRNSSIATLCGNAPFKYLGCSQNDEYKRYHFCEGSDERIIYIVLCDEEREMMIKRIKAKWRNDEFIYKESLKGMFVGEQVKHYFFSSHSKVKAIVTDDGVIEFYNYFSK